MTQDLLKEREREREREKEKEKEKEKKKKSVVSDNTTTKRFVSFFLSFFCPLLLPFAFVWV